MVIGVACHFANENVVVASLVDRVGAAFEMKECIRRQRRAITGTPVPETVPFRAARFGEAVGQFGLVFGKDGDRQCFGRLP
jgi:dihydrodipicolinate reductase